MMKIAIINASMGIADFVAGTSTEAKAAIDLKILIEVLREIKNVNSYNINDIINGVDKVEEYVAVAEIQKPVMMYASYLTNVIYTASDKSAWNMFVSWAQGKEEYNDFDRIYNDEIN